MSNNNNNAQTQNDEVILLEDLKRYFECPVCLCVPRSPPIYQCDMVSKPEGPHCPSLILPAGSHHLQLLPSPGGSMSSVPGQTTDRSPAVLC